MSTIDIISLAASALAGVLAYARRPNRPKIEDRGKQPPPPPDWTITPIPQKKGKNKYQSKIEITGYLTGWSERHRQAGKFSHVGIASRRQIPLLPYSFGGNDETGHRMISQIAIGHVRQIHVDQIPDSLKKAGRRKVKIVANAWWILVDGQIEGFSKNCAAKWDRGNDCPTADLVSVEVFPSILDRARKAWRKQP